MLKLLSDTEQKQFHHRYRNNDLFRQWSGILCQLEREAGEMDAVSLWFHAESYLQRLRNLQQYRDEEIPYIFNELIEKCRVFAKGTESIERSQDEANRSAITVMCVMLTSLMNSVEKGHEYEDFNNKAMCVAITGLLQNNRYFNLLINTLLARKIGNDGKEVVITPSDPMLGNTITEDMDEVAKEEIEQMVKTVISHTQKLKTAFNEYWMVWQPLWHDICLDPEMILMMKKKEPRTTDWGVNQKMVLNVVGMFKNYTKLTASIKNINDLLCSQNMRSYITNHADYSSTNTVFTSEQHDRIRQLIEKHVLSMKDN